MGKEEGRVIKRERCGELTKGLHLERYVDRRTGNIQRCVPTFPCLQATTASTRKPNGN